jgi:predicted glycogen debranching enzyme
MSLLEHLSAEWLEADGLGGFASGTVSGIRSRRYHAILLAATTPPSGRMVLVNGFDAEVETPSGKFAISSQRYAPGVTRPDGPSWMSDFSLELWPRWTYSLPEGTVVQELFVPHGGPAAVLRWTWHGSAPGPIRLRVTPFLSGRDFHAMHHENAEFHFEPITTGDTQRWTVYPSVPAIVARSNGTYHHEPNWYCNFLYDEERARGMDFIEDLAAPGVYEFDLAAQPAVLLFTAGDFASDRAATPVADLAQEWTDEEQRRRSSFATPHLRSADAYLVRRGEGRTIIAGYPWFGDWGRDTFIAMRGICLATGRLQEAREILLAWAPFVSEGMLPNRFPDVGDAPEYNSVDASLWYIIAAHEYLQAVPQETEGARETLLAACDSILTGYSKGTRFGIRADSDGLLACGVPGVQLTWMDAKVGDWVVTPRVGKPVEVQALWLNALALAGEQHRPWHLFFVRGLTAFHDRFWNEAKGCLYDVVDVDHQPGTTDGRVRPNQVFALGGLPMPLVDGTRARRMMQVVQDKLWTPMGLRSLAPDEPGYAAYYHGGLLQRDGSYHQGTVWPWLTGAFVEAWVRLRNNTPESRRAAHSLFLKDLSRLDLRGLRHIPEIDDATTPFLERGCPFQAWSLGELLRLDYKVLAPSPNQK